MVKREATSLAEPDGKKGKQDVKMLAPAEPEVEQPVLPGFDEPETTKRPKRQRRFSPVVVLLIAAIMGIGAWRFLWPHGKPETRPPQDVQAVGTAKVTAGSMVLSHEPWRESV